MFRIKSQNFLFYQKLDLSLKIQLPDRNRGDRSSQEADFRQQNKNEKPDNRPVFLEFYIQRQVVRRF